MTAIDALDVISNETYERHGYPHDAWARLRRESPVHRFAPPGVRPFWAITKHADIVAISKNPALFQNAPRLAVFPGLEPLDDGPPPARHLINMDPPEHGRFRRLISSHFAPRQLQRLSGSIEAIARDVLDQFAGDGGERSGDFVAGVSATFPLAVLCDLLGAPRADWPLLFQWTNETIGANDPEFQQQGESAVDTADRSRGELFRYFWQMIEARRRAPTDDIVSVLANARVDGAHVPEFELLSYCFLLVVAGNETTRNATSGGLLALIRNPDQLAKLQRDPALIDAATEEIVRWTSPVIQFCRTPLRDVELRGQHIPAGDHLCLFYPSANRDEEVFDEPFAFRVDRAPNPHLGFGIGEHFCLGANLARLELRTIFRQLLERLESIELAGEVARLRSSFVGGIKSMPVRYRLRPAG
ncbi:cytochrome P450 [bacterium]|nr:cytochrome P450 [bacterium]